MVRALLHHKFGPLRRARAGELNTRDKRREFVTAVMRVALWALKRTAEGFAEDSAEDFSDDF